MHLNNLTLVEAKEGLKNNKFSAVELTEAALRRIKDTDPKINALVTTTEEEALKNARSADAALQKGEKKALLGIPFVVKDNFCTFGIRTTAASKVLDNFIPPYNATVINKLRDAGIVLLGKANMDAWAHGSSTETSDYGPTKNPWDTGRLPGGSSGGTAASVATDQTIAGIGSETAGSIRQPASWCGIVGLKPTYGRVSRYGVVSMGSSLDSPGPMTKTVEDSALILNVLAGKDPLDATTSPKPTRDYTKSLKDGIKGKKIGVSKKYTDGVEDAVGAAFDDAVRSYEKLGAEIVELPDIFDPKYSIAVYTIIQRSEVSSNLARYDGIRYGNDRNHLGDEAKRRIMLGTYALSAGYYDAYYKKAQQVRTVIIDDFKKMFETVDVLIAPTSPTVALPLGASKGQSMFGEMADVLVEPSSIAGIPGINVNAGFSPEGLPIGLQIMGSYFEEEKILNFAYQFEQATEWNKRKPVL
jgi:aspartyl-tRNA(Asn)/glutamyl-tRNA(Gln) amidotransferase subunit A